MLDFRQFFTFFKKISIEFLVFKESYPIRMEALSFINLIVKKNGLVYNNYIYDELIKCIKKHHLLQNEFMIIKNCLKGPKVHSVFLLISIIVNYKEKELIELIVNI